MPVDRAKQHHKDRVAETLRDEISSMIEGELSDPRIHFAYVSEVILVPGGKSAQIFVAIDGQEEEERETLDGLNAARGYIRRELQERLGKRHIPELTFTIDRSQRLKSRMDELLGRAARNAKKTAARASAQTAIQAAAQPKDGES
jgi:ribosome-binding factor A